MNWLDQIFAAQGIEANGALSFCDVDLIRASLLEKEEFEPRSVLLFLIPYYAGETKNLSLYAAAKDYHLYMRALAERLICGIREKYPEASAKGFADHSPIDERTAAARAGLGILGENGLLIHEKYGSFVFIGEIITDLAPEKLFARPMQREQGCEKCGICRSLCPTGILRGESDACLSAITQRKGELSEWEIGLMRKYNTVWGCDECQRACPHNLSPVPSPIPFFHEARIPHLSRELLDEMGKDAFAERAFAWRGRKTIERNLDLIK